MRNLIRASFLTLLITVLTAGWSALAQEGGGETPQLSLQEIIVEPTNPAADTLCKLRVKVANSGSEVASQLDFKVKINGKDLPVYRNQLFMYPLEAGKTAEIDLYNFWSTETSRPMPGDGKLNLEISLVGAQWTKITMEDEVEVWQPLGEVAGLPVSQQITLNMQR